MNAEDDMSTAKELFEKGELRAAIDALNQEVRSNPTDLARRTFLFELLCFAGDWDRAAKQIDVIGNQSLEAAMGVTVYSGNVKAERERVKFFADGTPPHFLREPPSYVDMHIEAMKAIRAGKPADARTLLDKAEEERPAMAGTIGGKAFEDFRDYDDIVAPVLELIVKDQYAWLPLEQVRRIEITPPKKLRDLVWASARVEADDGTIGEVYIPCLYNGTPAHTNELVKLGRMTDWVATGEDVVLGAGLRTFLVDGDESPMLEERSITFKEPKKE
jgi:type VI secretion system protein ImpE